MIYSIIYWYINMYYLQHERPCSISIYNAWSMACEMSFVFWIINEFHIYKLAPARDTF